MARQGNLLAAELRQRIADGEYPDTGCDSCAGVLAAPPNQTCDHRCVCGRQLKCEHGGSITKDLLLSLAVAAADSALWAIERGAEDDAAQYAKDCVTACRRYQLAGGHPADGGEKDPFRGFSDEEMWRNV